MITPIPLPHQTWINTLNILILRLWSYNEQKSEWVVFVAVVVSSQQSISTRITTFNSDALSGFLYSDFSISYISNPRSPKQSTIRNLWYEIRIIIMCFKLQIISLAQRIWRCSSWTSLMQLKTKEKNVLCLCFLSYWW